MAELLPDDLVPHTKGPWCVEAAMSNRAYDIALDYQIPEAGSPILIASTYADEDELPTMPGYISPAEAEANARLMAAAPELLEALRLLLKEMELSGNARSKDYGWLPAITKSRAAVAKAEGRSRDQ